MSPDPRFLVTPIPVGSLFKLRSQCLRCGEARLVSVIDGSLEQWHNGHKCEDTTHPKSTAPATLRYPLPARRFVNHQAFKDWPRKKSCLNF